jgi:uncharacterized protein
MLVIIDARAGRLPVMLVTAARFGILNAVMLDVRDRVHDIGIQKALGMTPRQTLTAVLTVYGPAQLTVFALGPSVRTLPRDEGSGSRPGSREAVVSSGSMGRVTVTTLSWEIVPVEKPDDANVVIGQAHFIKTVEDLHEAVVGVSSSLRFGLAFCEASGPRLVRRSGNDPDLVDLATRNALAIGAGHSFVIFLREGFPINVLNPVKAVPEVCTIHCATANPVDVLVAVTPRGRGVVGVIDGQPPLGVETDQDVADRRGLLRAIGYKL